jgi:acetate---CoA ligase (ADP-forming)
MIVNELLNPKSIVIIGASNDTSKPGGKILRNLLDSKYNGKLMAINPKETEVQGIECVNKPEELESVELAVMAVAAGIIPDMMEYLAKEKGTKAFIILSAGFSEIGKEGKELENRLVRIANDYKCSLIGPNCIGVMTTNYAGVFAGPIPKLAKDGCDFVTGSGATAVFVLEAAINMGLTFSSLFSVGNSAQIGVEDILRFWDETFDPDKSSRIKLIYIEQVAKPALFLKHARSLINKGCKIAAIKAGTTEAGSRAVSSHTGALAGSDMAVDALFRKAGIVRCSGREELAYVAGIFANKELKGDNIAVITHAGGPGVMLTDRLSKGGLKVPHIEGTEAEALKEKLFHGSSVANPIDFLATGTPEQLGTIIDYVENKFTGIDASAIIFGTPGLFDVTDAYNVIHKKMKTYSKPIYPVMPSLIQAKGAMEHFMSLGHACFHDEVNLGAALTLVRKTPPPFPEAESIEIDRDSIRRILDNAVYGYLAPHLVSELLDASGIPRAKEVVAHQIDDAYIAAERLGYPLVMKVVGPIHKSDVGGVVLNVRGAQHVGEVFERMMKIPKASAVLLQPMYSGTELFVGAVYEPSFGHMILCGLGGIFIEVLKDVSSGLVPVGRKEAMHMIRSLKSYDIIKGVRGKAGVDEEKFAEIIVRLSALLEAAPEIIELDLNPLLGRENDVIAVDARIKVKKL